MMMINFLQPLVRTHHGPLSKLGQQYFEWLLADVGVITHRQAIILIVGSMIVATITICYMVFRPRKKRQQIYGRLNPFMVVFWIVREIKNYIVSKIRRKKR
jgi:hypothetical protein